MNHPLESLAWIEELLPPGFDCVPKHGGLAYYLEMKLVLILVERKSAGYEHKGVTYPFEIWNGCILPVEQKKQSAFFLKFLFLENHPASKDWLYIPAESEDFEAEVKIVVREIVKGNPLLGIPVKFKTPVSTSHEADYGVAHLTMEQRDIATRSGPKASSASKVKSSDQTKAVAKKPVAKKMNADKKHENKFLMSMLKKKIR